jgi:NAD(P)H-quinone oxidoreductase subunit 5
MKMELISLLTLLPPIACIATAIASWFQPGIRPVTVKNLSIITSCISIIVSLVCCVSVCNEGLLESPLVGMQGLGFSIRLDAISTIMLTMIALLSFVIIKFSLNYLDGEDRQGAFIGRLTSTIACVQLLVISGNIGLLFVSWVFTSISLHRLLVFYPGRPGAIAVARKKFIVARMADFCLLVACVLLYTQFQTGNLETIFQGLKNSSGLNASSIEIAGLFVCLAAIIKSAQFPTHGWLVEVMEAPTPVSALLHAGLINAGPFLIIRMSHLINVTSYSSILLLTIGGFTALFASVVFLTQTSVKTALGYSSVAHMGFSLLLCGLGVYAAAMLHLVAHSFYKAHAFLSSGSTIDLKRGLKITPIQSTGDPAKIMLGILSAIALYTIFAMLWGVHIKDQFALLAVGMMIILGLARIFTIAIDADNNLLLITRASITALIITGSFFMLESAMHYLIAKQIPLTPQLSLIEMLITILILSVYATVVLIQIFALRIQSGKFHAWQIHLRNGLYINVLFDRLIGALNIRPYKNTID